MLSARQRAWLRFSSDPRHWWRFAAVIGTDLTPLVSFLIYLRIGTGRILCKLYQARADGAGLEFKPGITYFLRLLPSQAHGHDAFAIG
ncbi:MAG: hypothetical protein DMG57_02840 [Acidobacteria bacterium]|nr:MAG: hypothetical protein DMG57_02840 [Acidobacteriota bacterium]